MTNYEQPWCDALAAQADGAAAEGVDLVVLYVVTDTEDGKVAFHAELTSGKPAQITAGRMPRGHKADVTVTVKEPILRSLWVGEVSRDSAFMAGDIKIEGAYQRWLDELVPLFESDPWKAAWANS